MPMKEPDPRAHDLLVMWAPSTNPADRLHALYAMRDAIASGHVRRNYFDLAKSLVRDSNNDCRWQALIVIGEYIQSQPEAVWQVIQEFGVSPDDDMRTAVATVLVEHLLEYHSRPTYPECVTWLAVPASSLTRSPAARHLVRQRHNGIKFSRCCRGGHNPILPAKRGMGILPMFPASPSGITGWKPVPRPTTQPPRP
jgi:hypothetical protein